MIQTLTAFDIIQKALRVVGVVGLGDNIDPLVGQEALLVLNGLRAEWSLNVKNYKKYDQTFTATSQKQFITLGSSSTVSGDILIRPNTVTDVILNSGDVNNSNLNIKLQILPYEMYREINVQNMYSLPDKVYIDNEYPLQNLYFYPGLSSGWNIRVMGNAYMIDYENPSDSLVDPPEYFDALYLGLALKLAPMYGMNLSVNVQTQAASAIKHIKHHMYTTRQKLMFNQNGSGPGFNFYAGR